MGVSHCDVESVTSDAGHNVTKLAGVTAKALSELEFVSTRLWLYLVGMGIKGSAERWANFGRHPWLFRPLVSRASRRTLVATALPDGERGIERAQGDEPRPLGHVHSGGAYVVSVSRRLRTCWCVLGRFKILEIYRMPYNG